MILEYKTAQTINYLMAMERILAMCCLDWMYLQAKDPLVHASNAFLSCWTAFHFFIVIANFSTLTVLRDVISSLYHEKQ